MDPAKLAAIKADIQAAADTVGSLVGTVDPELIPIIGVLKGVAVAAPDLVNDIEGMIEGIKNGNPPTDDENTALAAKIASLQHPETL